MRDEGLTPEKNEQVRKLVAMARELSCTPAQLALAWCLNNRNVSTVITGASSVEQVRENMKALDVFQRTPLEVWAKMDQIFQ
jgi:aryl-alcohol dehydrogenase-like predicted oxidoreductase